LNNRKLSRGVHFYAVALTGLAGLVVTVGCDKQSPTNNSATAATAAPAPRAPIGTGVVDLDAVADAVQWKAEMEKDNATARSELSRIVTSFAADVEEKVKQHKADLIKTAKLNPQQIDDLNKYQNLDKLPLTKEQLNTLVLVLQNQQRWVQSVDQKAGQMLQQRRSEILQAYRNATKPIVRQIAEQQQLTMVLLKNDGIFYASESVDLTNRLIDEVRKNPPKITYPSMPTMNLPSVNLGEMPEIPATGPSATRPAK